MVFTETALLVIIATLVASLPPLRVPFPTPKLSEDRQVAPAELLKAFGMSEPGVRRWYNEPPQYMLDLYNEVADSSGLTRLPGPYGATIVRAFSEKDRSRDSIFSFSVTGLGADEHVLEVEFHVHYSRLPKAERHLLEDNVYTMEVEWVTETGSQVLVKEHVAAHSSGWRVFKVGSGVVDPSGGVVNPSGGEMDPSGGVVGPSGGEVGSSGGVVGPSGDVGPSVVVVGPGGTSDEAGMRVNLQVTATTLEGHPLPVKVQHGAHGTRQPLLVLFTTLTDGNNTLTTPLPFPEVRKKLERPSANRVRRSLDDDSVPRIPSGCERRDMYVDFDAIGWSSWIVYPKNYNAYHCTGQCSFPLGQNLNPTNHATVQSIIHHSGEFPEVQRPCCVPSAYANLSLLFYDAEENVVLKQYDQMVAMQCGCH